VDHTFFCLTDFTLKRRHKTVYWEMLSTS